MRAVEGGGLPAYASTSEPVSDQVYELWTCDFDLQTVSKAVEAQTAEVVQPELMLGGTNTTAIWIEWIAKAWPC